MTSFADLGLDGVNVQTTLQSMDIDVSAYSVEQLSSLMLVSDIVFRDGIFNSAENVEALLFEYTYQSDRLASIQSTFNRLLSSVGTANAEASTLIDFLQGTDVYLDAGDMSLITIDHSWSYSSGSTTYTLDEFETLQDFVSAIENNSSVNYSDGSGSIDALEFGYNEGVADGWFEGIVSDTGVAAGLSDFLGGGDYYIQTSLNDPDSDIDVYLDLDGFQEYLVARVLNEAGYLGDDVKIDPLFFATSSPTNAFFTDAVNTTQLFDLYFGRTSISFDSSAGTLSLTYNGAAAMREMGLPMEDYFEEGKLLFFSQITSLSEVVDDVPLMDEESDGNWMLELIGAYLFSDVETFLSNFGISWPPAFTHASDEWSELSDIQLTNLRRLKPPTSSSNNREDFLFLDADNLDDMLEDVGTEMQSQSSTGELALVEASTALTEWSELHGGWDTVHKYVTDALGRAVALLK